MSVMEILADFRGMVPCVVPLIVVAVFMSFGRRSHRHCHRCGAEVPPPARFCGQCGVSLRG